MRDDKPVLSEQELLNLYHEHGNYLLRLCTLYLKDSTLAEDAVQDTFIKAWEHYQDFRNECCVRTWLVKIAVNICNNYLRSPWCKKAQITDFTEFTGSYEAPYSETDMTIDIMNSVLKLPEKYRIVILLYYYEELTVAEISQITGRNKSTISSRLERARKKLNKMLSETYNKEDYGYGIKG